MGFCLLEKPLGPNGWMAINPTHLHAVKETTLPGYSAPASQLVFPSDLDIVDMNIIVKGTVQAIENTCNEALKVGMGKAEVTILGGQNNSKAMPLQLNNTNRIVLMKELDPEEFFSPDCEILTAGIMLFEDNTIRHMVERPAIIANLVNAGGDVPRLMI